MKNFETLPFSCAARRPADYVSARVAVTTNEQITVPAGANIVVLNGTNPFYVAFGTNPTAVVPAADVDDGTSNELISPNSPLEARTFIVVPGEKIGVASGTSSVITASFYTH